MTGTVSPAIPTVGQSDSTEEPKIPSAIITLRDSLNAILTAANRVDGAQIAAGSIPNSALATILLSKLAPGTNAQIPISNGGSLVATTLTGNVTNNSAGETFINNDAVETVMIQDGAVTKDKLAPLLGHLQDSLAADITFLSSSWVDILSSGTTVSGATYLVNAFVDVESHNPPDDVTTCDIRLFADGAQVFQLQAVATYAELIVPIMWIYTTSSTAPIKIQAQHNGGAAGTDLRAAHSRLTALRIG